MNTILRYEIPNAINDIELPVGYNILKVGIAESNGIEKISIWCQVDVHSNYKPYFTEKVRFLVFGTGANMDEMVLFNYKYIGTVQKSNAYAFHVYQVTNY